MNIATKYNGTLSQNENSVAEVYNMDRKNAVEFYPALLSLIDAVTAARSVFA